jgi:hypothetical protein
MQAHQAVQPCKRSLIIYSIIIIRVLFLTTSNLARTFVPAIVPAITRRQWPGDALRLIKRLDDFESRIREFGQNADDVNELTRDAFIQEDNVVGANPGQVVEGV